MTAVAPQGEAITGTPVIEVSHVGKRYGHITALNDVSFQVRRGEVVALVGDNGAGKSTLVNILSGAITPSVGKILLGGEEVEFRSANEARTLGVETVYQDLALANDLAAWANLFLGREVRSKGLLGRVGWLDRKEMTRQAEAAMDATKIRIKSIRAKTGELSGGQRQAVAVARAVTWGSRVLLMDEPTAALGVEQQHQVGELIGTVKQKGTPVLVVSHNLPQVEEVADRILVLFRGHLVKELVASETSTEEIVAWITGAALARGAGK
jgi:simple sugar transport system ATP-binding protein